MKKRLRKKTHVGARVEWGVPMAMRRRPPDEFDGVLDHVTAQAIEAHGLTFGGGGHDDRLTGVIEVGRITDPIEACLQPICRWLETRVDVA